MTGVQPESENIKMEAETRYNASLNDGAGTETQNTGGLWVSDETKTELHCLQQAN